MIKKVKKKKQSRSSLTMVWDAADMKNIEQVKQITGQKVYTKMIKESFRMLPLLQEEIDLLKDNLDSIEGESREIKDAAAEFVQAFNRLQKLVK